MSITAAILQSNYIPWKGYFDLINMADVFVYYDDVQFTRADWRNRNKIKTRNGPYWLTVPCGRDTKQLICDVKIKSSYWQAKHWRTICHNYSNSSYFDEYQAYFEPLYIDRIWDSLVDLNHAFIECICREVLGITTEFDNSCNYDLRGDEKKEDRWLDLMHMIGADRILLGPSARNYLQEESLANVRANGIEIVWVDYSGYPEYRQPFPPFDHKVSIIDLIFAEGPHATALMKSFG